MNNHERIFNRIASIYQWFYGYQLNYYREKIRTFLPKYLLPNKGNVLDLGCGTGAFGMIFKELGFNVLGVDAAPKMVARCQKNNLNCDLGNIFEQLPFNDHQFEIVISAFVLHGFQSSNRVKVYKEAARLSANMIIFYDYKSPNHPSNLGIRLIEKLEGSDYQEFIKLGFEEMLEIFPTVEFFPTNAHMGFYLIKLEQKEN